MLKNISLKDVEVNCEAPNKRLYSFDASMLLNTKATLALSPKQVCS